MDDKKFEKNITPRATDYSQWYLDVISAADLAEYAPVKGCMIIKPNGYALWERVQEILNREFKSHGVQNAYFPMLIPEHLLKREADHIEGFAPEVAVVTIAGGEKLEEPLILRPTSETIMYEVFSNWIHSYRDLPLLINQWANVIRWEMKTKPFLRTTEFLWQEGHTVHKDNTEADIFAKKMLDVYKTFFKDYMALPVIIGMKSESEKFAGAQSTYTCEAMMQDGKALQIATSHNLGDHFAKVFNVQFLDENNVSQYGHQTSWGLSTRSIGGLIMTHSDDKGLIIPPKMANTQVIIIPIVPNDEVKEKILGRAKDIAGLLNNNSIGAHLDERDSRPGEKHFAWEKRGIPIRIEFGPKDDANDSCVIVRRDTGEKIPTSLVGIEKTISTLLDEIQQNLYDSAFDRLIEKTKTTDDWNEFVSLVDSGAFVLAHWDGTKETEKEIKEATGATIRCLPFDGEIQEGICIKTGKISARRVLFAKAY